MKRQVGNKPVSVVLRMGIVKPIIKQVSRVQVDNDLEDFPSGVLITFNRMMMETEISEIVECVNDKLKEF